LVEQLRPFGDRKSPVPVVHNMKFLEATNSLYLATSESVLRIPTHRCGRFRTKQECLNSMDPYCGWNNQKSACTLTPNKNPRAAYWQQNAITCPVLTDPVSQYFMDRS
jgi:semaphorin 5